VLFFFCVCVVFIYIFSASRRVNQLRAQPSSTAPVPGQHLRVPVDPTIIDPQDLHRRVDPFLLVTVTRQHSHPKAAATCAFVLARRQGLWGYLLPVVRHPKSSFHHLAYAHTGSAWLLRSIPCWRTLCHDGWIRFARSVLAGALSRRRFSIALAP